MKDPFFVSDFTKFINDYLEKHPEEEKKRAQNRLILWDKNQDIEFNKKIKESSVDQKPYVYSTD